MTIKKYRRHAPTILCAAVLCAAAGVSGCADGSGSDGAGTTARTTRATASAATGDCPIRPVGPADPGSVATPGPMAGVEPSDAVGERLVIAALVLTAACQPAAGTSISVWHTDAHGLYGPGGEAENGLYYQATVRTDPSGRFELDTIRPAQYPEPGAPPAHIHLDLRHSSGGLMTEIHFSGDGPPATTAARGAGDVAVALQARTDDAGPYWYGEATFVLGP